MLKLDWAEPGDPPLTRLAPKKQRPASPHLGAPRPERRKNFPPIPKGKKGAQIERWLIELWRGECFELDGVKVWTALPNESALNALCEAHRPMVVNMAQGYIGTKRKIVIEYGMFGLRLAPSPQWPNRKKKGSMAGYDPTKARFNTFARHQARRFMDIAAAGLSTLPDRERAWPLLLPRFEDSVTESREWAETPIPSDHPRAYLPDIDHDSSSQGLVDDWITPKPRPPHRSQCGRAGQLDPAHVYAKAGNPDCCYRCPTPFGYLVYWEEANEEKPRNRNHLASPITALERETRSKYYADYGAILGTYDKVAAAGMEGWDGDGDDSNNTDRDYEYGASSLSGTYNGAASWEPCTGAFQKDQCLLGKDRAEHKKVLEQRRELARRAVSFVKQPGARLTLGVGPHTVIQADGLAPVVTRLKGKLPKGADYDRRGHRLPQFDLSVQKFIPKKRTNGPFICLKPLSGIYLVREEEIPLRLGGGILGKLDFRRASFHPRTLSIDSPRCRNHARDCVDNASQLQAQIILHPPSARHGWRGSRRASRLVRSSRGVAEERDLWHVGQSRMVQP